MALLEGRALGLAVVGEHHDLVRARRVMTRPRDAAELLVELAQSLERVGALEARMVGHLVVAREGRVDGRSAAHHVGEHGEDHEVADDDAHRTAHQRVDAAPVAAGADVAAGGAERGGDLDDHLPDEQDERPGDVEAVGEEGPVARVGAALGVGPAHGQDRCVGLAREQVAAARPAVDRAVRCRWRGGPRSPRNRRARSRPSSAPAPSRPSERPGCRRSSRAGFPPGSPPSGTTGRAPTPRAGNRRRPPSGPCSARFRRASRRGAPAARGRRSRGRGSRERRCEPRPPGGGRRVGSRAACTRRRRWCRGSRRAPP